MNYTYSNDSLRKNNDKYTQLPINIPFDHVLTHELDYNGGLPEYEDPADYLRPVRGVRLA